MENKKLIRERFLKIRKLLKKNYIIESSEIISEKIIFFIQKNNLKNIGIYISNEYEIDTKKILFFCLTNKINIYIPRCEINENKMIFKKIKNLTYDLEKNQKLNIIQPIEKCESLRNAKELDAVFLPVVAFDNTLMRIGSGKGYYDRWFNENEYKGYKIGLAQYTQFSNKKIDANNFDVKLDEIVSENNLPNSFLENNQSFI
ncbi:5-formyltetrahydrofolate cyclo-ligase [Williamsoniiplasma somnilux]|uniref:5-formyltetrahydrofolate cyclo-ligase n=1 Tax=Williamsoniiplasma somnilux TaxID=215578 RepID=A0A2K8NXT9_9MOLU|nr:5-formyltetrahydrofolate cyclo-ligase [Williamsoniiplasma somnilux]ATZ18639.1 5-formyltetrahydrofolate cyclo-ligase [Williamsoniiplasma somnilux]